MEQKCEGQEEVLRKEGRREGRKEGGKEGRRRVKKEDTERIRE